MPLRKSSEFVLLVSILSSVIVSVSMSILSIYSYLFELLEVGENDVQFIRYIQTCI